MSLGALQTLRPLVRPNPDGTPGRLIAVFGCAGLRDRAKRDLMGQVSGRLADFTVITAEDPRTEDLDEINRAIEAGVREHAGADAYCIVPDRAEAIRTAVRQAHPGDVVAAFGKGHERSMCFGTVEQPWSDQAAMIAALDAPARRRNSLQTRRADRQPISLVCSPKLVYDCAKFSKVLKLTGIILQSLIIPLTCQRTRT